MKLICVPNKFWYFNLDLRANNLSLVIVNPSLWLILLKIKKLVGILELLELFKFLRAADTASKRENATLFRVIMGRWVSNSKGTIDAMAIFEWHDSPVVAAVARLAHVVSSKAAEEGSGAAVHTLPVNLDVAMLLTSCLASADFFEKAIFACKVLLASFLFSFLCLLLLAINQATKVRLLTAVALVEGAAMQGVLKWLALVEVTWGIDAAILEDSFCFSVLKCHSLDLSLHLDKWS